MSLTQSAGAFAGVHEDGLNDFIEAFFRARPRYLRWGSPAFVPATTVNETQIPAIPPFGIDYLIDVQPPRLDLFPDTAGFSLPPGPGQFALEIKLLLTVGCARKEQERPDDDKPPVVHPVRTELVLCGVGHLFRIGQELGIAVDELRIKEVAPESLSDVLSCMLRMIVQYILRDIRIPYQSLFIQIGTLVPQGGIVVEDDTAKAFANIV